MNLEIYEETLKSILVGEPCLNSIPHEPTLLVSGLYIGSQRNAEDYAALCRHNITHVVNCAGYKGPRSYKGSPYQEVGIDYLEFLADDHEGYDITKHFRQAFAFIDKARVEGGVVLVHCALGINRSGAVCLGYLVARCRMKLLLAAKMIKSKRRVLLSNRGFQRRIVHMASSMGLLDDLTDPRIEKFVPLSASLPRVRSSSTAREKMALAKNIFSKNRTHDLEKSILDPRPQPSFTSQIYMGILNSIDNYRNPEASFFPSTSSYSSSLFSSQPDYYPLYGNSGLGRVDNYGRGYQYYPPLSSLSTLPYYRYSTCLL